MAGLEMSLLQQLFYKVAMKSGAEKKYS